MRLLTSFLRTSTDVVKVVKGEYIPMNVRKHKKTVFYLNLQLTELTRATFCKECNLVYPVFVYIKYKLQSTIAFKIIGVKF